ncbi:MAG: hypothetical protein D6735_05355, partial [Acidobacteria bacterium]
MNQQKEQQIRLLLAVTLSMIVLTAWTYFFAPEPPKEQINQQVSSPTPEIQQEKEALPIQITAEEQDNIPNRTVTIKTPLYQIQIDSKGALAKSWILIKNVHDQHEKLLFADGSDGTSGKPLELIPEKALETRALPFRLMTDSKELDSIFNERNYTISENSELIELKSGESKRLD